MMKLPVDIRDILSSGRDLSAEKGKPVRIAIFVDVDAPDVLVDAVRIALRPLTTGAQLHIEVVAPGETLIVDPAADAVVALAGEGATLGRTLVSARERFVPSVVVAFGDALPLSERLAHPILDTVAAEDPEQAVRALGKWLADRLHGKRIALASNFEFVRRAVAEEAIRSTAFQNAVIGFVVILPGADMPIMTANQAKMVLQIAAAYGEELGPERIKELAAVVGGGFVLRAVARQALDFVPGLGWALKAGIGYSGTLAMGYAALEYFEAGGDPAGLATKIREVREKVAGTARKRMSATSVRTEATAETAYVTIPATESIQGEMTDAL
ncbi:MAG: DUF697 domain-containing protein [Coriobacteriia bacterium]|nr:DUF697 domain-containing protein [Coriobacteriia bacterium]